MANRHIINARVLEAMDSIALTIWAELNKKDKSIEWLSRASGVDRKTIYRLIKEPYSGSHLGTYVAIFDALGLNEITIKWR